MGDGNVGKDGDDDRAGLRLGLDLAETLQSRHQPRYADGESRCRHRLAAKARNQPVVTAPTADGAEANRFAIFAFNGERQLNFVDGASIVLKTADDGGGNVDAIPVVGGVEQASHFPQFTKSGLAHDSVTYERPQSVESPIIICKPVL